jgi:hypothetical protein
VHWSLRMDVLDGDSRSMCDMRAVAGDPAEQAVLGGTAESLADRLRRTRTSCPTGASTKERRVVVAVAPPGPVDEDDVVGAELAVPAPPSSSRRLRSRSLVPS